MPGLYSIVDALQDMRTELKGAADDAESAAEKLQDYAQAVEQAAAAETTSEKTRAAGGGAVSLKGLNAAISSVTGRTGR